MIKLPLTTLFSQSLLMVFRLKEYIPRSNSPAWKRPVPGDSGDFVEAVFRSENFRTFSGDIQPVPAGKYRKLAGIRRKNPAVFLTGILLPRSSDFRCFPGGYGDYPASFLQYPAGSGGRNVRPGYSSFSLHLPP